MGFVKDYDHCVFVSYATVDDVPPVGADLGWVSALVMELKRVLAEELGRAEFVDIWMDQQLGPHDPLTPTILEALEKSAALLVILSPGYLESKWCSLERKAFLDKLDALRETNRVFLVEKKMIHKDDKPKSIRDIHGLHFWTEDAISKRVETLGMPLPSPTPEHKEFYSRVGDLGRHLATQLKIMNQTVYECAQDALLSENFRVLLAEVTDDLQEKRYEIKRYLEQRGITVVEEDDERELDKFSRSLEHKLLDCELFVQLLSQLSGKPLPNGYVSFPHLRYTSANNSGIEILQWYPPDLKLDDLAESPQKNLLLNETVISESIEQFKERIVQQLDRIKQNKIKQKEKEKPEEIEKMIFINHATGDEAFAQQVCDFIYNNKGWGYAVPLSEGRPSEIRSDLERNIKESDSMFLLYGDVNEDWVREQLVQFRKLKGGAHKSVVLFEGPPPDKGGIGMRLPGMRILDFKNGFEKQKAEQAFVDIAVA